MTNQIPFEVRYKNIDWAPLLPGHNWWRWRGEIMGMS